VKVNEALDVGLNSSVRDSIPRKHGKHRAFRSSHQRPAMQQEWDQKSVLQKGFHIYLHRPLPTARHFLKQREPHLAPCLSDSREQKMVQGIMMISEQMKRLKLSPRNTYRSIRLFAPGWRCCCCCCCAPPNGLLPYGLAPKLPAGPVCAGIMRFC